MQTPGSNCGSQPQENWHRTRWHPGIPHLRLTVPKLVDSISELLACRADVAMKSDSKLVDIPGKVLDHDLLDGSVLAHVGRSVGTEFVSRKAITRLEKMVNGEAHVFCVMMKLLWVHGEDGRYHARSEVEVPLVKAEALVRLLLSKTMAEARACLPSLYRLDRSLGFAPFMRRT